MVAKYNRYGTHCVHNISIHLVWITKYWYKVMKGNIQLSCRELIKQICNTLDINILKGVIIVIKPYFELFLQVFKKFKQP